MSGAVRAALKSTTSVCALVQRSHGLLPMRCFSTEAEQPPLNSTPRPPPFFETDHSGLTYGNLLGVRKHALKTDIINFLEGCNLTLEDVKMDYDRSYSLVSTSWADPTQPYPILCSKAQPSHAAQHRMQPSHATKSNTPHPAATPHAECSPAATTPRSPRTTQQRQASAHDPTAATSTGRRPREGDVAPTLHLHERRRTLWRKLLQFPSRDSFDNAVRVILRKGRLYKLDRVNRHIWDQVKPYDGKTILIQGMPRAGTYEDIGRILSGFEFDSSSVNVFLRPGGVAGADPIKLATVRFNSRTQAMNAYIAKNGTFCQNNRIWIQVIQ
ncbi:hypothetical protein GmHk_05G012792 [Glycine max]|nr:hypothetical protein GmHk_05G012792 [Glycine max]